jgi:DNA-binding CsgD family transcriptional regulator
MRCGNGDNAMRASTPDHAAAVDAIYRTAAAPEFWREALAVSADYVGAGGGFLIYTAPQGQSHFLIFGNSAGGRMREDLVAPYFEHYAHNPYARAFARARPDRVYRANQLVDVSALRRSSFQADILAPQRMEEQIVAPHASLTRGGGAGGACFVLSAQHLDGTERAMARVGRLAPHFARAIDLTLQLGRHQSSARQIERILDAMPSAALLLDRKARIIRTNAAADALLRQNDGLSAIRTDGLALVAQGRAETRMLLTSIAQAVAVADGEDQGLNGSFKITRPSGRAPLLVLVTPLPPPAFSLWEAVDGGARAMVQIVDPNEPTYAQAEALRTIAGLTPTEARVAALVGAGPGAPEIAATLGVSITTVKTHLSRVFDKTGARSQAELARLIASIPVPTPRGGDLAPAPDLDAASDKAIGQSRRRLPSQRF